MKIVFRRDKVDDSGISLIYPGLRIFFDKKNYNYHTKIIFNNVLKNVYIFIVNRFERL